MMNTMHTKRNQDGFTLLEVLIAVAILTIGILSVNAMQLSSIQGNSSANRLSESTNLASEQLEFMLNRPYNFFVDGNGANNGSAGLDDNGVDDNNDGNVDEPNEMYQGNRRFVDPGPGGGPDGSMPSADGRYTIFWNVANNFPQPNMKTIRVFVQNASGTVRTVSFTNCKTSL